MCPHPPRSTLFSYTTLFRSLGDPGAEAHGGHGRPTQDRSARQEALDRPAHGFGQEVIEHRHVGLAAVVAPRPLVQVALKPRSEEHTSELQSPMYLVCRLLLE